MVIVWEVLVVLRMGANATHKRAKAKQQQQKRTHRCIDAAMGRMLGGCTAAAMMARENMPDVVLLFMSIQRVQQGFSSSRDWWSNDLGSGLAGYWMMNIDL
jgi:hypothetical protein